MGSGEWFKSVMNVKRAFKDHQSKEQSMPANNSKAFKWRYHKHKGSKRFSNGVSDVDQRVVTVHTEDSAAVRIQTAFRAFLARKALCQLKGMKRIQFLTQCSYVQKQTSSTLFYLQLQNKIQRQVRARRRSLLTESRINQKKRDHELKLEAKLHEIEVEWSSGSESMEEVLARVHAREAATIKRERALAYAYSHQWRTNTRHNVEKSGYDPGEDHRGWNWTDHCITAWPRENKSNICFGDISSKKNADKLANKRLSMPSSKTIVQVNSPEDGKRSSGKNGMTVVKRLSFPSAENSPQKEANERGEDTDAILNPEHPSP